MQSIKKNKLIVANSILLVLLVVGFAFAWFAVNYSNIVEGDQVEIVADSALEISFTGADGSWKNYLNLNDSNSGVNFDTLEFRDITGSGDGTFWKPALNQGSGFASVNSTDDWLPPTANKEYIKFDLYMRSADPLTVSLGDGASVTPLNSPLIGANAGNKSSYGNFSKDLVAGAVRVSATHGSNGRIFTWIPRPNIYLAAGPEAGITSYDIITNAAAGGTFSVGINPYEHWYYPSKDSVMAQLTTNVITGDITTKNQQLLVNLTTKDAATGYYQDKITVYVWLEGCDNEARRAFVGGNFKLSFALSSADASVSTP